MPNDILTVEIKGASDVAASLVSATQGFSKAAAEALNEVAESIMTAAKKLTPVDTGRLRDSGSVREPATALKLSAKMSFATEYAAAVHEIPPPPAKSSGGKSATHKVGQWKYLETPLKAAEATLASDIAAKIARKAKR